MNKNNQFSLNTTAYLTAFRCILDTMIQKMTEAELTDSISHNFIVQMIPHHRAAIEMSRNLLKYTTDIPLQNIALSIISEQTESIKNMENILPQCQMRLNRRPELCMYQNRMDQIMQTMFKQMKDARPCNDINISFMREMIPHHRGAIEMSKNTLQYPICPQLIPILRSIISSQEKGVAQMTELLELAHSHSLY